MLQHIEIRCQQPRAIKLVQLTDTHVSADEEATLAGVNTTETLTRVITALQCHTAPDLVLLTGDLVEAPSVDAYEKLAGLLQRLELPVYCLAGNHDDPMLMQRLLNTGHLSTANLLSAGAWSIILLNTHETGAPGGSLSATELSDLDMALQHSRDKHVLICLHHQPVAIRSAWMDAIALKNSAAMFRILDRYSNVKGIIWGHIHQEFSSTRNGVLLLGSPSTCVQFRPRSATPVADARTPAYRSLRLAGDGAIQTRVHWL